MECLVIGRIEWTASALSDCLSRLILWARPLLFLCFVFCWCMWLPRFAFAIFAVFVSVPLVLDSNFTKSPPGGHIWVVLCCCHGDVRSICQISRCSLSCWSSTGVWFLVVFGTLPTIFRSHSPFIWSIITHWCIAFYRKRKHQKDEDSTKKKSAKNPHVKTVTTRETLICSSTRNVVINVFQTSLSLSLPQGRTVNISIFISYHSCDSLSQVGT